MTGRSESISIGVLYLEQTAHFHRWNPDPAARILAAKFDWFQTQLFDEVFSRCGLSVLDGRDALGRLMSQNVILRKSGYANAYYLIRSEREKVTAELSSADDEPELTGVSQALSDHVEALPDSFNKQLAEEAVLCCKAKAYRAAVVMSWNFAFNHLTAWVFDDQSRLDTFNASWTMEWLDRKKGLHQVAVQDLSELQELKESKVLGVLKKAGLVDKTTHELLDESLRKRNTAAHPNSSRAFTPSIAAGHVDGLLCFVLDRPLSQ